MKFENGLYDLTVLQLFDPKDYEYDPEGKMNFEIVIQKTEKIDRFIGGHNK